MADNMNANIGFEAELWKAACSLWGHINAADYRKVITGLIFLRYVSSSFERRYNELPEEDRNDRDAYTMKSIFFVPKKARWEVISAAAHRPNIGVVIDDAMRAIERENRSLEGVLPKMFASPDLDQTALGNVVDIFTNNIDMSDPNAAEDLLGRTYEYCIAHFAETEGKSGGEFYTPACIVRTLVEVLEPRPDTRVYDCCCGSGGMFVQSERFIRMHSGRRNMMSIYGQEANPDTWKMAKMNLAIRGIAANLGEHHADTFTEDLHKGLKADYILANPPFNYHPWGHDSLIDDPRWLYGLPPKNNANFAWMQHMIYHLAPHGRIGLVLANGALSAQDGGQGAIRAKIVDAGLVEGIVALPSQLFYSVTIPVSLWFLAKDRTRLNDTLFIDARKMGHMVDRTHRALSDEDIARIAKAFDEFRAGGTPKEAGFCAVAKTADIAAQDYTLTPGRYVGLEEQEEEGEPFDEKMERLLSELSELFEKSHTLEDKIRKNLEGIGYGV